MANYLIIARCLLLICSCYHHVVVVCMRKDYSLSDFRKMGDRQVSFVLDTWLVPNAWMNPSMILDPVEQTKLIMVWRVPDLVIINNIHYMIVEPIITKYAYLPFCRKTTIKSDTFGSTQRPGNKFVKKIGSVVLFYFTVV